MVYLLYSCFFFYKSNVFVNIYLIIFFSIVSVRHLHGGFQSLSPFVSNNYQNYFTSISLFSVPAIYLYFKSLYKDSHHFSFLSLIHFLFPTLKLVWTILKDNYEELNSDNLNLIGIGVILFYLLYYLFILTVLVYKNVVIIDTHKISVADLKHHDLIKKWSFLLYVIIIVLTFRILFSVYIEITSDEESFVRAYNYSWISSVVWMVIFAKILFNTEILNGHPKLKKSVLNLPEDVLTVLPVRNGTQEIIKNQQDTKLSNRIQFKTDEYLIDIEQFVTKEHPFRNSKYSIKDLAEDLKMPISHLSYIFKYHCSLPFLEYRNCARINDALHLIEMNFLEHKTLEALSLKVGFTSYNPFYISFKKHTGKAPSEYLFQKEK